MVVLVVLTGKCAICNHVQSLKLMKACNPAFFISVFTLAFQIDHVQQGEESRCRRQGNPFGGVETYSHFSLLIFSSSIIYSTSYWQKTVVIFLPQVKNCSTSSHINLQCWLRMSVGTMLSWKINFHFWVNCCFKHANMHHCTVNQEDLKWGKPIALRDLRLLILIWLSLSIHYKNLSNLTTTVFSPRDTHGETKYNSFLSNPHIPGWITSFCFHCQTS